MWDDQDNDVSVWDDGLTGELLTESERKHRDERLVPDAQDDWRRKHGKPTEMEERLRDLRRELRLGREALSAAQAIGARPLPRATKRLARTPQRPRSRAGLLARLVGVFTPWRKPTRRRQRHGRR